MPRVWKLLHVRSDFPHDGLCDASVDPRYRDQQCGGFSKRECTVLLRHLIEGLGAKVNVYSLFDPIYDPFEILKVLEKGLEREAAVFANTAAQDELQFRNYPAKPSLGEFGKRRRIILAVYVGLTHKPARFAHNT